MAHLLSVNVGRPREIAWRGKTVYTSVWKAPVQGRRLVGRLNVDGDAQGDLHGHGGEHRAVFVYQMDSYQWFAKELKLRRFSIALLQVGQEFLPVLLGACLPHDLTSVQRLALARRLLGGPVRQQVFQGEWLRMRGMGVESVHQCRPL